MQSLKIAAGAALLALGPVTGRAALLFENGPIVTNPTGGTGAIAGLPISSAEPIPGFSSLGTTGFAAAVALGTAAADDFTVPSEGWDLDTLTVYAFQTSQTTPTITQVHVNLWNAPPFDANSPTPPPVPDPLPQPVLAADLVLTAGPGTFIAHRNSATSTSTVRPVFAYTVSLAGLPDEGRLAAGTYWIEFSMLGASSPSANVFMPLVTPRASAFNLNGRLFNVPFAGSPQTWFEAREGFVDLNNAGRPVAWPFALGGTVLPEPAAAAASLMVLGALIRRR